MERRGPRLTAISIERQLACQFEFLKTAISKEGGQTGHHQRSDYDASRRQVERYDKQKRQAEHIEEGYRERGVPKKAAERRAWATVNKESGGGKKSGSGRGKKTNRAAARKAGSKGGSKSRSERSGGGSGRR